MEAASTSKRSVNFYQTIRRNNPDHSRLHNPFQLLWTGGAIGNWQEARVTPLSLYLPFTKQETSENEKWPFFLEAVVAGKQRPSRILMPLSTCSVRSDQASGATESRPALPTHCHTGGGASPADLPDEMLDFLLLKPGLGRRFSGNCVSTVEVVYRNCLRRITWTAC
jgi:hypothetical protein